MAQLKRELKRLKLSQVIPYDKNPNIHPKEQIDGLAQSITRYTQYRPIVVDENMVILNGHGLKMALEQLGETEADVLILKGLTEKQKMKFRIEDGKIQSLSYMDFDAVERTIKEIGDVDIIGFPTEYIDALINEVVPDNMGANLEEQHKPVSKSPEQTTSREQVQANEEERNDIEAGMEQAKTIICPHCGKEIVL